MSTYIIFKLCLFALVLFVRILQAFQQDASRRSYSKRMNLNQASSSGATVKKLSVKNKVIQIRRKLLASNIDRNLVDLYLSKFTGHPNLIKELHDVLDGNGGKMFLTALNHWISTKQIRSLKDWKVDPNQGLKNNQMKLLSYLFEQYEVPDLFKRIWWTWRNTIDHSFFMNAATKGKCKKIDSPLFDLYFYLANGYSIRKYPNLGFNPSKRECFYWLENGKKNSGSILSGFWKACFLVQGGKEENADFIYQSQFNTSHLVFWRQFMAIVARDLKKTHMAPNRIGELVGLINLVKFGILDEFNDDDYMKDFANKIPHLSLKGRSLKSLEKYIYNQLGFAYKLPKGMGELYTYTDKDGNLYQIRNLSNRNQMMDESYEMDHCIDSWDYHIAAMKGEASYWTIRYIEGENKEQAIMSVELKGKDITQFQAYSNECPSDHHMTILKQWVVDNELMLGEYEPA